MKAKPAYKPGKKRIILTPFLDAWRPAFIAATEAPGERTRLAHYLTAQGRRTLRSNRNLIANIRAAALVPNAEDFLVIQSWLGAPARPLAGR